MFVPRFLAYTAIIAAIIYTIAAYNCQGYYHPDEHYQLIEFAGLKTGSNTAAQLPWEYASQIRPSLQPYICYFVLHELAVLHITDPYQCAFVLRWLTAMLAILIITKFVKAYLPEDNRQQQIAFILLSFFIWCMPYLNTRFSSEIWSGLSFLLAMALLGTVHKHPRNYLLAGICMGTAFLFRYQLAFMIGGMVAWLLFIKRIKWSAFGALLGGGLLALFLGAILDYHFYGSITFPYVNYFRVNIVEDVASQFGIAAWYYYITFIYHSMTPFIGVPILVSVLIAFAANPRSPVTWMIIPFFFVHSIIPHKEGRFLFPLVYYIPIILLQTYIVLEQVISRIPRFIHIVFLGITLGINTLAFIMIISKPAANGRKNLSHYIHEHYNNQCLLLIHTPYSNPYDTWGMSEHFYLEPCMRTQLITLPRQLSIAENDSTSLVIMRKSESQQPLMKAALYKGWEEEMMSIPAWIWYLQGFYDGHDLEEPLVLYRKKLSR